MVWNEPIRGQEISANLSADGQRRQNPQEAPVLHSPPAPLVPVVGKTGAALPVNTSNTSTSILQEKKKQGKLLIVLKIRNMCLLLPLTPYLSISFRLFVNKYKTS